MPALQDDIHANLEQLAKLQLDIEAARGLIEQCRDCPNRPNRNACPHCPVDRHIELPDIARLIWDPDCP